MRTRITQAALAGAPFCTALLWSEPALAHRAPFGITGYPVLVLHPFIVQDHALCLAAAGLFAGQQEALRILGALLWLSLGIVSGFACLIFLSGFVGDNLMPLICAAIIGGLVAAAPQIGRWPGRLLITTAGFAVGLNTYPEAGIVFIFLLTVGGLLIGAAVLVGTVAGIVSLAKRDWQRIGARIAGSWVVASAILILALISTRV